VSRGCRSSAETRCSLPFDSSQIIYQLQYRFNFIGSETA
jgi:hypothetical protein